MVLLCPVAPDAAFVGGAVVGQVGEGGDKQLALREGRVEHLLLIVEYEATPHTVVVGMDE